jgi:cobalamin-dependent methionine synthase I
MGVDHSRLLVDGMTFSSLRIAPTFSGCSQVAIFVATIGGRLEERVAQLMKEGLMLEALIMDIIGSVAVEKVAGWLENMIRNVAAENGSKIGWRYSPGYCDWDITQQRELFRAFDGKSIGINLTRECLMIPRKSISGIVGIGESCITYSACRCCNKKNCPTRREEFAP